MPIESDEEEDEEEDDEEEEEDADGEGMEVDVKQEPEVDEEEEDAKWALRTKYRPKSPDMSWLPPLPTDQITAGGTGMGTVAAPLDTAPAPQSVADRYRRPVAFATSSLAEAHTFSDPPAVSPAPVLPSAPSSFSSLIDTYQAVVSEPSVALRQTDGRRQAADLLRLTVGNPEIFTPKDTLSIPLPPPHVSPIVPTHSETLPAKLLPVNPNQTGIVSSLLHQIRSPYLPPPLRERLTALRPPMPQNNDNGPILYGPPVRGADESALAKARGKAVGDEPELYFRATWDSGPRGSERWSRGDLPTGKKVMRYVEGQKYPRESAGAKALRLKINEKAPGIVDGREPSPGSASSPNVGIKLRLGAPKPPDRGPSRLSPRPSMDGSSTSDSNPPTSIFFRPPSAPEKPKSKSRSVSPSKRSFSGVKQEPMMID